MVKHTDQSDSCLNGRILADREMELMNPDVTPYRGSLDVSV